MTPWVIDAKDIDITADNDELKKFRTSLFHTNSQINKFMDHTRHSQFLVVGPKGYGKTLLLKLKRSSFPKSGYMLLPEDALLDKPIGTPYIFALKDVDTLLDDQNYWRCIWLISISLTVLKATKSDIDGLKSLPLRTIFEHNILSSACDIFDRLLALSRKEYFIAYDDFRQSLIPSFRRIHSPVAIFIDNVDEYFEHAISFGNRQATSRSIKKTYWYLAQFGLASAARELNSLNNHVKICASIRQEVFQRDNTADDPLAIQIRGSCVELNYDKHDLIDILKKNILAEPYTNVPETMSVDPYPRFFGRESLHIEHAFTNEDESIEDFFLRHTLWRPRDIAIIGGKLSEIDPKRRTPSKIREIINTQATLIADTYLGESRPHVSNFSEETVFPLISSNVLSFDEITEISRSYDVKINTLRDTPDKENHVFSDLYRLGLLGIVQEEKGTKTLIQHFQSPGQTTLSDVNILPRSKWYLVHPILYDVISRHNATFYEKMDTLNIVGRSRPWRRPSDIFYVIKGDVVKYSEIMLNADTADMFPTYFRELVSDACKPLAHFSLEGGDSLLLIDRNLKNVVAAARAINDTLHASAFKKQLRFGGDAGFIRFSRTQSGQIQDLRGGALRTQIRSGLV